MMLGENFAQIVELKVRQRKRRHMDSRKDWKRVGPQGTREQLPKNQK